MNVRNNYIRAIHNITNCMEERFSSLYESPLFKHMVTMLDVSMWSPVSDAEKFANQEIIEMIIYFESLFSTVPTEVDKIIAEWVVLKTYILPIISNNKKSSYVDIWKIAFTKITITKKCRNILYIFELILICPFTDAKLKHIFWNECHLN